LLGVKAGQDSFQQIEFLYAKILSLIFAFNQVLRGATEPFTRNTGRVLVALQLCQLILLEIGNEVALVLLEKHLRHEFRDSE